MRMIVSFVSEYQGMNDPCPRNPGSIFGAQGRSRVAISLREMSERLSPTGRTSGVRQRLGRPDARLISTERDGYLAGAFHLLPYRSGELARHASPHLRLISDMPPACVHGRPNHRRRPINKTEPRVKLNLRALGYSLIIDARAWVISALTPQAKPLHIGARASRSSRQRQAEAPRDFENRRCAM